MRRANFNSRRLPPNTFPRLHKCDLTLSCIQTIRSEVCWRTFRPGLFSYPRGVLIAGNFFLTLLLLPATQTFTALSARLSKHVFANLSGSRHLPSSANDGGSSPVSR